MAKNDSVWLRPAKSARAQPALDRERIIAAAIELLDEESVAGLTMRKLATRLGAPPMTLYGHVATKDDLLEYALDAVFAESLGGTANSGDWRADLTDIAHRLFAALMRHPWSAGLVGGSPPVGPAAVAQFGAILRVLGEAGFADEDLDAALAAFYYYVLGAALAESAWHRAGHESQHWVTAATALTSADAEDPTPVVEFVARFADTDAVGRFDRGLRSVLSGLSP